MDQSRIAEVITPAVEACGLEVEEISITAAGKRSVVRVVVDGDGPQGRGPTLDEITEATRAVSAALDESGQDGNRPYTLELTSRGTSRPLTQPQHWRRNRGRLVHLGEPDDVTGRIVSSDDTGADVEIDGVARRVEFASVGTAVIQPELTKPTH